MPLIRAEKEALIEGLLTELRESRVALVIAYTRLHMKANDDLRTKAFEQGAKIKMISNNLLTLLLKKMDREMELPQKTLALAYGYADEVEAAKSLVAFGKETDALEVLGGWIDGNFFDMAQVKTLSALPGKEQLQAQVVGRLAGLIQGLAYNLNYPIQKFAFAISALERNGGAGEVKAEAPAAEQVAQEPKTEEVVETPAEEASAEVAEEPKEEPKSEETNLENKESKEGENNE